MFSPSFSAERERVIALIPELCHMTGLTDRMRSNFQEMKAVNQVMRSTPQQRSRAIHKFASNVNGELERKNSNQLFQWEPSPTAFFLSFLRFADGKTDPKDANLLF
jgi:hypothetical protein